MDVEGLWWRCADGSGGGGGVERWKSGGGEGGDVDKRKGVGIEM